MTGHDSRLQDDKKRYCFCGHGEPSLDNRDRMGLSQAKEILAKQGYDAGTVSLLALSAVPDDTAVLAVAGPRKPITTDELDRIHAYVQKGGHLLLMADPDTRPTLLRTLPLGSGSRSRVLSLSKTDGQGD